MTGVLDFFYVHRHVEDVLRAPRTLCMADRHIDVLIEIMQGTTWLYLGEIAEELEARCRVKYLPGLCCTMLKRRGRSLQVMHRIARQRDERKFFRYFMTLLKVLMSQLAFADEVGQDGRGSRRRRGLVAGCDIREFLNRGKHVSILALYGITRSAGAPRAACSAMSPDAPPCVPASPDLISN